MSNVSPGLCGDQELNRVRTSLAQQETLQRVLHDGLRLLGEGRTSPRARLLSLLAACRNAIPFEHAFVLGPCTEGGLRSYFWTAEQFADISWYPGPMMRRVLSGDVVAGFDTDEMPEWLVQPLHVRQAVRSVLHVPIEAGDQRWILVCTHAARGAFQCIDGHHLAQLTPLLALALRDAAAGEPPRTEESFLSTVSHEMRTPLNAIIGTTELALDSGPAAELREQLDTIRTNSESLLQLVNDLLDSSKIDAGQLEIVSTAFDPTRLVEGVAEVLGRRAYAKALQLVCRIDPWMPSRLVGDPDRLRQILLNLGGNAVKFTERGEIRLRVDMALDPQPQRVTLRFTITDTGIGIPHHLQQQIFERFYRGDRTMGRRYGGIGMGLSISKQLVELMGGAIEVESHGRGSVFTVRLPLEVAEEKPFQPAILERLATDDPILVVDANPHRRQALVELLDVWGLPGTAATTLDELASLLASRAARFATILLDEEFADPSAVLKVLHQVRRGHFKVALLSAAGRAGQRRAAAFGARLVLDKPVRREALLATLARLWGIPLDPEQDPDSGAYRNPLLVPTGVRVLLAEDNLANQKLARRFLEGIGCAVDIATDGAIAFEHRRGHRYDLILMDLEMPNVDGLQATQRIRAWERAMAETPVPMIALSAHASNSFRELCLNLGMNDYLTKPIRRQTLIETVIRHLEGITLPPGEEVQEEIAPPPATESKRPIIVDPDIADLVPTYLEARRHDVKEIERLLPRRDFGAIQTLGHNMKGSGRGYGFAAISELGARLEAGARSQDPEAIAKANVHLARYLDEVEVQPGSAAAEESLH